MFKINTITYLLILLFFNIYQSVFAKIEVKSSIMNPNITIGQQTVLSLSVEGGKQIEFPTFDSLQIIDKGIEVLSFKDSLSASGSTSFRNYIITSFDTTSNHIASLTIKVDGQFYSTKEINFHVQSVEIDTTSTEAIYDLKEAMLPPFNIEEWSPLIYISLFLMFTGLLMAYIIIRLKENKPIIRKFKFKPYSPPHKTALKEIISMRNNNLWQSDDVKNYYTRLTETLRKYIQGRYGFKALEMTSVEIIQELQNLNDKEMLNELELLFKTADLVKFAKAKPDIRENDINLSHAEYYIENTKKEEVTVATQKEIIVEDIHSKRTKRILYTSVLIIGIALTLLAIYLIQQLIILI